MTTLAATVQEQIALPASARGMPEAGGPPTASDILAMMRRRIVLIVFLFVVLTALTLGGFVAWWKYLPGYRSECLIECISNIPETELTVEQVRLRQDEHERFVRTQALLLKSPSVLGDALKVTAVRETQWFRSLRHGPAEPLLVLDDELNASPVRGTNFLRVTMQCRNPQDASVIVNEVVNQWYHTVKKRTAEDFASDSLAAAQQELDDLNQQLAVDRDRLKGIARRLPAGAIQDPSANITAQQVRQFGEQVALLKLELSQLEQYRTIYNDPTGVAVTAEDRALVEQNPQVAELARSLFLLEQQRAGDEKVYGRGHSVLRQLDARIEAAGARLAKLRIEKLGERRADMREATNTAYDNTRFALLLARENLAKAASELQDQDRLLFDYFDLEQTINQDTKYRVDLDTYVKNLGRVKAQRTAINVNVAQAAIPALKRSSPSMLLIPMGLFFSLAFSIAIGLGLEVLDKSVRTAQDVVRHLDIAVLGAIPDTDDEEIDIAHVETAVRDAPRSMVAEAFRRIRTNLQFCAPAERQRTIIVTSPRPEDGKTTVAGNLAMAVAGGGRRVLLVDANFRRPAIQQAFGVANGRGLSNMLIGEETLESCVTKTTVPFLDILGSGPTPPNPVELLGSENCRAFLREAMSHYDQVILDTAPALLASDAVVLAPAVDGVILVVRANRNSRGVAKRACSLFAGVRGHLFGAVLNAARVTRGGYYREQLRSYYEYQSEAEGIDQTPSSRPALDSDGEPPPRET